MAQGLTVVFDCNIYVTAAQAIGYSGSLADLEHIAPTLPFYRRKRAESLLWALKGGAGPAMPASLGRSFFQIIHRMSPTRGMKKGIAKAQTED